MSTYTEENFQTKFNLGDILYWLSDKINSGELVGKKIAFRQESGTVKKEVESHIEYDV